MDTQLRPSRHRFELGGGAIPECRVTAGPIIEHFEPLEDLLLRFCPCGISSMRHEFRFERMEEAFHDRIVPTICAATHADRDAMAGQELTVQERGILRAAVRMVQQARRGLSPSERHGQCLGGQRLGEPAPHRPGNGHARVEVQYHGQIQPALCGPDIRDVAGPHAVGFGHGELTVERVGRRWMRRGRVRGAPPLLDGLGANGFRAHEPGHPVFAHPLALSLEGRMDSRTAICPS